MPPQDTTNHPAWTGEENTVSSEDEHMARFLKRFGVLRVRLHA